MRDTELEEQLLSLFEADRTSIPDNGFTEGVMSVLPKRRSRVWLRQVIIPVMTLAGCWLGLIALPGGEILEAVLSRIPHAQFVRSVPVSWLILVYVLCWAAVASVLERRESTPSSENSGDG